MRACAVGLAGGPPRKGLREGLNFLKNLMRSLKKKKIATHCLSWQTMHRLSFPGIRPL